MSFCFPSWPTAFSPGFHEDAKTMLEGALNKGSKPPVIQGKIEVVELSMGKEPPTLTLLEIGDLSTDRFRGIFRLGYQGDAWIEVKCRVQANPLSHNPHLNSSSTLPMSTPLLASQPLLVPMTLRLSSLNLRAILILVVSKSKGITLVFKNDPLQNVDVSSTFDSIEVIRGYLQQEIEGQLKELFREDLPGIIHRLSQKWFGGAGMSGKVEMPYRNESVKIDPNDPHTPVPREDGYSNSYFGEGASTEYAAIPRSPRSMVDSLGPDDSISVSPSRRHRSSNSVARRPPVAVAASDSPTSYTTFPEIENYDPTYGLRPEGIPTHTGYEAFGRLWETSRQSKNKGLGSLMSLAEEITFMEADETGPDMLEQDIDDDEGSFVNSDDDTGSVDAVDASPSLRALQLKDSRRQRSYLSRLPSELGWNPNSMVGNEVMARPRVYHVQSQIRAPSDAGGVARIMPSPSGTIREANNGSVTARASSVRSSAGGSSVGLGMARSILDGPPGSKRMWSNRTIPPQFRPPTGKIDSFSPGPGSPSTPRAALQRSHSRADSLPLQIHPSPLIRGPSKLQNVMTLATNENGSAIRDQARPGQLGAKSRPMSIQGYPSHPTTRNEVTPPRRRPSTGYQQFGSGSPPSAGFFQSSQAQRLHNIILPLNDSVSQLASLSHSNHTLSPYARSHEHIAVRSFPHLSRANSLVGIAHGPSAYHQPTMNGSNTGLNGGATVDMSKVKAKRKRLHRLGGSKETVPDTSSSGHIQEIDSARPSPEDDSPNSSNIADHNHMFSPRPVLKTRRSYGFPVDTRR